MFSGKVLGEKVICATPASTIDPPDGAIIPIAGVFVGGGVTETTVTHPKRVNDTSIRLKTGTNASHDLLRMISPFKRGYTRTAVVQY